MRVVGVDPGLAACGYAVVDLDGSKAEALVYGCWQTQAGVRVEVRLRELYLALIDLLARYKPDAVALEESFVGRDARVALMVGQVRGTLLVAAARAGVGCSEYPPATVKQASAGTVVPTNSRCSGWPRHCWEWKRHQRRRTPPMRSRSRSATPRRQRCCD